jgi:hypothetical protein
MRNSFVAFLIFVAAFTVKSQAVDQTFPLNMAVQTAPQPTVTFTWTGYIGNISVMNIERRALGQTGYYTWTSLAQLSGNLKTFTDTGVARGNTYEYRLYCPGGSGGRNPFMVTAVASIEAPLEDQRGGVILVVDNSTRAKLGIELQQLEMDLVGDGWFVKRIDTEPAGLGSPVALKAAIKNVYDSTPGVNSMILFGNVPYVRSGLLAPDGHAPGRAHETDTYFADMLGAWTDATANSPASGNAENENIPGDGKFDQNYYPGPLSLATGRVYFENMTLPRKRPLEYLRDYLHKDHAWRHAQRAVNYKAVAGDTEYQYPWYNWLNPIFGTANVSNGWFGPLETESRIFGIGTESINLLRPTQAIFMTNFKSYKQHWLRADNLIIRNMAQPDWGLTSTWGGRPSSYLHSMAAGKPLGWGFLRSQNDIVNNSYWRDYMTVPGGIYTDGPFPFVSYNLMGDPTLRLHPVPTPSRLQASRSGGSVQLTWMASPSPVVGYHLYRSTERLGPYTRLTTTPIAGLSFSDTNAPSGEVYYQVRSVVLTDLPNTGSYYNQSQGVFTRITAAGAANRPPAAASASTVLRTKSNTPLWFRCQGTDPDGDPIVPIILTNPQSGQIRWRENQPFYISGKDFSGTETITYVLSDGISVSEPAQITINVDGTGSTLVGFKVPDGAIGTITDSWHSPSVQPSSVTVRGFFPDYPRGSIDLLAFSKVTAAFNANNYLEWDVTPFPGYRVSLDRLNFSLCAAAGAVVGYELRVSTDNFVTWSTVPSQFGNTMTGVGYDIRNIGQLDTVDLSQVAALQNVSAPVKFRLHVWKSGNPNTPIYLGKLTEAAGSVDGIEDLSVTGRVESSVPLALQSVVSRKNHGDTGSFDAVLPLDGTGVESRLQGGGHTIVLTFDQPLNQSQPIVPNVAGGQVTTAPQVTGNTLTLQIAQMANGSDCSISLAGISSAEGTSVFNGGVSFRALEADVDADRNVGGNDATVLRKCTGRVVNGTNFRSDINADGKIDGTDALILRKRSTEPAP